jgi:hypothetical protein
LVIARSFMVVNGEIIPGNVEELWSERPRGGRRRLFE